MSIYCVDITPSSVWKGTCLERMQWEWENLAWERRNAWNSEGPRASQHVLPSWKAPWGVKVISCWLWPELKERISSCQSSPHKLLAWNIDRQSPRSFSNLYQFSGRWKSSRDVHSLNCRVCIYILGSG